PGKRGMPSGGDVLKLIEHTLGDLRRELDGAAARLAQATAELERLRQEEIGVLGVLARIRLREIESAAITAELDETGQRVRELLARRADQLAAVNADLAAAQRAREAIERERETQHTVVEAAEQALDAAEAEAQKRLGADASYRARLDDAAAADRVAALA